MQAIKPTPTPSSLVVILQNPKFSTRTPMSVFTIFCFLSTFFIIQLALPFYDPPRITLITVQVGLIAAILAIILNLCAAQCIGTGINQVREIGSYAD